MPLLICVSASFVSLPGNQGRRNRQHEVVIACAQLCHAELLAQYGEPRLKEERHCFPLCQGRALGEGAEKRFDDGSVVLRQPNAAAANATK